MLWERLRQINSPEAVPADGGQEPRAESALWVLPFSLSLQKQLFPTLKKSHEV